MSSTDHASAGSRSVDDVAEEVIAEVGAALRAIVASPAPEHIVGLTGGRDSRLVLAVAVHEGLADAFTWETIGYPGLPDVDVAASLTGRLGVAHRTRFFGLGSDEAPEVRTRRFVAATAGMVDAWDLDAPRHDGAIHVSGIGGEPLRSFVRLQGRRPPAVEVAGAFRRRRYARAGLLRPHVAEARHRDLLSELAREPDPTADPRIRLYAHYAQNRLRFNRTGPREELPGGEIRVRSAAGELHFAPHAAHASFLPITAWRGVCLKKLHIVFRDALGRYTPELEDHRVVSLESIDLDTSDRKSVV